MDQISFFAAVSLIAQLGESDDEGTQETESVYARITASQPVHQINERSESRNFTENHRGMGEPAVFDDDPQKYEMIDQKYSTAVFGKGKTQSTSVSTSTSSTFASSEGSFYAKKSSEGVIDSKDGDDGDMCQNFSSRMGSCDAYQSALEASFLVNDSFTFQEDNFITSFKLNLFEDEPSSLDFNLNGFLKLISSLDDTDENREIEFGSDSSHYLQDQSKSKYVEDEILSRLESTQLLSGNINKMQIQTQTQTQAQTEILISNPRCNENEIIKESSSIAKELSFKESRYLKIPINNYNLNKKLPDKPAAYLAMQKILNLLHALGSTEESGSEYVDIPKNVLDEEEILWNLTK